jgi:hypothetical protein
MKKKVKINKTIFGAIFLAIILWTYTTLRNEYVTFVKIPLRVIMPNNIAIENPVPKALDIEVKGKGWDIFNLLFFNTSKEIILDLSKQKFEKNNFDVGRQQLLKSVRYIGKLESIDALPDNIELRTGVSGEYFVNVTPDVKIVPLPGFILVDGPHVEPSKVRIKGNNKVVSKIQNWETADVTIKGVSNKFRAKVSLKDTLESIVVKSRQSVFVYGRLEQVAERTFTDIPVTLVNGKAENYSISPMRFDVTIKGGVTAIANAKRTDIQLILNAEDIYNSPNATAIVKAEINGQVQLSNPKTMYVYAFKNSSEKNMIDFATW